ncbi:MAG: YdeI/OmpD-associated family protein [Gordonia sp. (in: high G+C Gram-positive bacteria)]|uniref:YdeI/OmpD-associated family protein n=1 Tax=Gordonia sp. (in: high G+C Gram-positive bacteria) TaxID=84139 RepID=UPI0039E62BF4
MPAKTSPTIRFTAEVERVNDRTLARIPAAASAELPSRGQVAVTGTLDGANFATVVEPDGRRGHWVRIDDAAPGSTVTLELTPAERWPEPAVPQDLREALDGAPDIADTWTDITPMARWEWVRWIGATKNPATRRRRVEVGIDKLRNGKRRPCCFDLSSCTDPEVARSGVLIGTK